MERMTLKDAILKAAEQGDHISRASWRSSSIEVVNWNSFGMDDHISLYHEGEKWIPTVDDILAEDWILIRHGLSTEPVKTVKVVEKHEVRHANLALTISLIAFVLSLATAIIRLIGN